MSKNSDFLSDKVANNGVALVRVVSSPAPQVYRANVEKIYFAQRGLNVDSLGKEIEFVGGSPVFGNMGLKIEEKVIIFISWDSGGKLYEDSWLGHMPVEEIDGELYAICQIDNLWLREAVSMKLREASRPDPKRPHTSAVRFDVMEAYLSELIKKVDPGRQ